MRTVAALIMLTLSAASDIAAADEARIKAFCIDFNWGDAGFAEPGLYTGASPQAHVDWYRSLGANTIQTFCVSCPGHAWYRSEVAPVQPGMAGEFLPEVVRLGHEAGMKVMGYFCIGANAHWSKTHPAECHPFPNAIAIPFATRYLDYLDAVIREAVGRTGIDGFMIDWVYNASHFYPDRAYAWLACERQMYTELFEAPWPGDDAMDPERIQEFNRRALARCWEHIRNAAKDVNPDCIIWLTCFDLQHPQLEGARMLQEVDWLMNEHPDPEKLVSLQDRLPDKVQPIQCVCGWGENHNARKVFEDPRFESWGIYGFAKPDPATTLPPDDQSGNAKNIAVMREFFRRP